MTDEKSKSASKRGGLVRRDPRLFFNIVNTLRNPPRTVRQRKRQTMIQAEQALQEDPKAFYTSDYLYKQEQADWRSAPSELRSFAYHFDKELRRRSIPIYAFEVYRDPQKHAYYVAKGLTSETHLAHTRSCAVDLVHATRGYELTDDEWEFLGLLGKDVIRRRQFGGVIEWGGDWKGLPDPAHWQMVEWTEYPRKVLPTPERTTLQGLKPYAGV